MAFKFPKVTFPFFERSRRGDVFYQIDQLGNWTGNTTNIKVSQNHPILTPAILFLSKLFSQAEFWIEDKNTGEKIYDHWILELMENPNYYQTKADFLETNQFFQIASGQAVVYLKRTTGFNQPEAMYLLNPDLIDWKEIPTRRNSRKILDNAVRNKKIIYDEDGPDEMEIRIKDLLFFYDMPNSLDDSNLFQTRSRIDGLKQTLVNTQDSLIAKNIILKTNGKELITAKGSTKFPLTPEIKKDAEELFQKNYGLSFTRKRGLVSAADLDWKSMHVALRDLGLDESIKVDGNLIYTALHIPKDILSLEAKKTTYNNFKESMVSYIQNEMQPTLNSYLAVFQRLIEENNLKLVGNYDKMPIMKFVLIEKFDGLIKKGQALSALRSAGLPDEIALEECGYDKNIELNELTLMQNNEEQSNESGGEQEERDNEEGQD